MSAEAPKGNLGCLPGFLRRFVARVPEPQPISQSKPNVVRPPLGLENFADQIQSVIDGRLAAQRQKENDIEAAKAAQIEADRKAAEALSKPYRDEEDKKYREKQEQTAKELAAIMEKFRVVERLEYIRDTVWGGKGEIRPAVGFQRKGEAYHETYRGGFELVYQYPGVKLLDIPEIPGRLNIDYPSLSTSGTPHQQKYVPDIWRTTLCVGVHDIKHDSGEEQKLLGIASFRDLSDYQQWQVLQASQQYPQFFGDFIPRETDGSETLLEAALKQETITRVDHDFLPSQLEKSAGKMLAEAQRSPYWQKWKEVK